MSADSRMLDFDQSCHVWEAMFSSTCARYLCGALDDDSYQVENDHIVECKIVRAVSISKRRKEKGNGK